MVYAVPDRGRPAVPVEALARLLSRRPGIGAAFDCGVRVVEGRVAGEGWRWRYRSSYLLATRADGVSVLHHGRDVVLRFRPDAADAAPPRHRWRPRYVLLAGTEIDTGARLRLSCRPEIAEQLLTARPAA